MGRLDGTLYDETYATRVGVVFYFLSFSRGSDPSARNRRAKVRNPVGVAPSGRLSWVKGG
ncbi:hypothetical protein SAMN02745181_0421 [Rubritalea squalenifaciens DSM 18772]|uniref:Uncharacterized protein n=1 Tax=Rubritalea squalenifaciens DSM 18772 TaxID=1123071 RepID=A0A1M6C8W9_9BACT|nr:hypothetical protein SAMN02745181_0421 [Rubritalea squalenifaciens DSM 18772]